MLWPKKAATRSQHIQRLRSELLEGKRRPCCWLGCTHRKDKELSPPLGAEPPQQSIGMNDASASQQIDAIVRTTTGWRGERLGQLRALIRGADPGVIEEVKWKKPSRPEGVPVWSHDGIVCVGEVLKNAVRLTFPKGAQLKDPKGLFNTRLASKTVRAIDFHERDAINAFALKALIVQGARLNRS